MGSDCLGSASKVTFLKLKACGQVRVLSCTLDSFCVCLNVHSSSHDHPSLDFQIYIQLGLGLQHSHPVSLGNLYCSLTQNLFLFYNDPLASNSPVPPTPSTPPLMPFSISKSYFILVLVWGLLRLGCRTPYAWLESLLTPAQAALFPQPCPP